MTYNLCYMHYLMSTENNKTFFFLEYKVQTQFSLIFPHGIQTFCSSEQNGKVHLSISGINWVNWVNIEFAELFVCSSVVLINVKKWCLLSLSFLSLFLTPSSVGVKTGFNSTSEEVSLIVFWTIKLEMSLEPRGQTQAWLTHSKIASLRFTWYCTSLLVTPCFAHK